MSSNTTTKSVVSSDDVTINYAVSGAGNTLLIFVHGWSCDRSYWRDQVEIFNDEYAVVTMDLAGHGQSGLLREDWTMAAFGADVAAVANAESADEIVLVGHSMGGPVILEAARLLGPQVKALIAVDSLKRPESGKSIDQAVRAWSSIQNDFAVETEKMVRTRFF